ncbi:GGDEF domain-containing protein [Mycolicibacterium sphagni]|uniref:GGDEF domain-containing protein n=1 Tax=Mycolicibacterium sphagni TaxID=1786 RepID=UPI0021F3B3D2|nr:GGDEF domain-containing protein [Mycolicibacterium sphagni]MCV7176751.1 GGDEF domain-containing protein [Mycolicibacterium sphagni]
MSGRHLRDWWSEPVDYAAQVQYFTKRAMSAPVKVGIGVGTGLNGVISLLILLPSVHTLAARVVVAMFAALQLFWGWMWCSRPWPSRRTSLAFVISADIGIAAAAVVGSSWLLGLFAFNAFAMISVYLLFFDGPKVLAGHTLWILLSTAAFAVQFSSGTNLGGIAFTAKTLASVTPVVATSLGIQFGIWALRNDANDSVTDPLTGLLNRRGLQLHVGDLLRDANATDAEVAVAVVDLDRFKEINDSFGHATGDQVLIRTARRITGAVGRSALVARTGGEEFVIVDIVRPGRAEGAADCIRDAIAAPADLAVTASVGVTSLASAGLAAEGTDPVRLLEAIVERADHAMFDAKRKGGNATTHLPSADEHGFR